MTCKSCFLGLSKYIFGKRFLSAGRSARTDELSWRVDGLRNCESVMLLEQNVVGLSLLYRAGELLANHF